MQIKVLQLKPTFKSLKIILFIYSTFSRIKLGPNKTILKIINKIKATINEIIFFGSFIFSRDLKTLENLVFHKIK